MITKGKKPRSSKPAPAPIGMDDVFGNRLSIPQVIKDEAEAKGLELRWIDAKKLYENSGYHEKGWEPYKRESSATLDVNSFKFGSDPTGVVRRGSVILATRPKAVCEKHRLFNKQRADRQMGAPQEHAEEMRQLAKSHGVSARVLEGYDDEGDDAE